MTESPRPFVAFISYSHRDTQWAAWIQKAVERYRLPNALAKETGLDKRIGKVFRDREELATGQNLGDHLLEALDNSDNLIVICSPNAVNSQWVGQEIEYFKKIGRGDRIFCLLVEGGAEALPEPLLTDVEGNPLEPLAADPRESGDGKRLAKLKLISGILGVKLDQLTRREQADKTNSGRSTQALLDCLLSWAHSPLSPSESSNSQKSKRPLSGKAPWPMRPIWLSLLSRLETRLIWRVELRLMIQLIDYLERSGTDNLDIDTMRYLAQAYQQLGIAKLEQGTDEKNVVDQSAADAALINFERSRELFRSVLSSDFLFDIGIAAFYKGYAHIRRSERGLALSSYAKQMQDLYVGNEDNVDFFF